jgi:hypothetical protein
VDESFLERKINKYNTCLDMVSQMHHMLASDGLYMSVTLMNSLEQLQALLFWELSRCNKDKVADYRSKDWA